MKPIDTRRRFRESLATQSLLPERLDPWSGWRAFKDFLRQEVDGVYDAAAVLFERENEGVSMFLVRQFSEREDVGEDAEDQLVGRLIVEFQYDVQALPDEEVWTLDYPTLEEWASVVESTRSFQTLVNQQPRFTDVYYDSGPD
jgi:hypothetical protein